MWFTNCFFCGKPIKEDEPCLTHYDFNGKHYRHLACKEEVTAPKDYVPFGNVTDEDLFKEEK